MIPALIALGLAAVLALSGTAKLLDPRGTTASLWEFTLPAGIARLLAPLLPPIELAIAVALVVPATARVGAAAALVLFAVFTAVVGATLARGRRPACGCFGELHSRPIGPATLARTTGLAALAAVPLTLGPGDGISVVSDVRTWLAAALFGQTVVIVVLLRRHGRVLERLDGSVAAAPLAAGADAPEFALFDSATEELVSLHDVLASERDALVVFSDPGCGACTTLLPEVAQWQRHGVAVAVISRGDRTLNRATALEHGIERLLVQEDREIADAFGATGTPAAVVVGGDGRISRPLVYGTDAIRALASALEPSPAAPVRTAIAVGAAVAFVPAAASAARMDDATAYRRMKQIIRTTTPRIVARERRFASSVTALMAARDKRGAKFKVLAEVALLKQELRRAFELLDNVATPDYQRGEKNPSRIAKSDATAVLRLLELGLDRFVTTLNATQQRRRVALYDETMRLFLDAEKRRRSLARRLGCTAAPEKC